MRLAKHSHVFDMMLERFGIIPDQCHYHFPYLTLLTLPELPHKNIKKRFQRVLPFADEIAPSFRRKRGG